jgi:hypothetical protein
MPPISRSIHIIPNGQGAAVAKPESNGRTNSRPPLTEGNGNGHTNGHTNGHADNARAPGAGRVGRVGRVGRDFPDTLTKAGEETPEAVWGWYGPVAEVARFLHRYIVFSQDSLIVVAGWVVASWLAEVWDRFPHLVVTSPEKRCGKTTLLDLLYLITPRARYTTNISPAALYRSIEKDMPTLLMDEAQSISRRGSETSEVLRELLNAGIGRNAKVTRCGGDRYEDIEEFSVYSPKVFAMIGQPDPILGDRSLPVSMSRKTKKDRVERYRSRLVEPVGKQLHDALKAWAEENAARVRDVYNTLEPFNMENDRMAELLLPLMAVLKVDAGKEPVGALREYVEGLAERDRAPEAQSIGVQLLAALREIFGTRTHLETVAIVQSLHQRDEEPWLRSNGGRPITREALANLLRPYGIRSHRSRGQRHRCYWQAHFADAWERYLPPPTTP